MIIKSVDKVFLKGVLPYSLSVLVMVVSFQNCGSSGFKTTTSASNIVAGTSFCAANPSNSACLNPQAVQCSFNGQKIAEGQTVSAYLNSTVAYGQTCKVETRTCRGGVLSGSYSYASCAVGAAAACLFNGQTIANGQSITAYLSSTVSFGGTCQPQTRTCTNGALSGSYAYGSCAINAASSCSLNGQTINHGSSVTAYASSTVAYGQACQPQTRTCTNGALSGTYAFNSCAVNAPASCSFNGQTIANGQSATAYASSTVAYGQTCQSQARTCANGSLSGSYQFGSCSVGQPAACLLNGVTVAHGQNITAYASSTVTYGQACQPQTRTCTNGALSGTYAFNSCTVNTAASCSFNGQTIASGQSVTGYSAASVAFGQTCQSQTRTCANGVLSGSGDYSSCSVAQPAACLFNAQTIAHGQSVTAYQASSVPYGQSCSAQTRTCYNGAMSGTGEYASCSAAQPASCLFNGQTVVSGQSVTAYTVSSVAYGQTCQPQTRVCTNGSFSGQGEYASCQVAQGQACLVNGQTIPHGGSTTLYLSSVVGANETCQAQSRVCTNGGLSGSATATSCMVTPYSIAQPTGLNAVIASNPKYLDYIVQNVCTDDYGNIIQGDPATCPKQRNIRLGEKFPYFVSDRDGNGTGPRYQANWSYPIAGVDGNLKVITFKEFRNLHENYSFSAFDQTQSGFDFLEFSSSYVSGTRTSDPGCYDQIFSTDGSLYNRQNAWAFFPVADPDTFASSASTYTTTYGTPISWPRKCNPGNSSGITYWNSPTNITFESGKTLKAIKSSHFAGTALNQQNNALELYYFTREYGMTRWEAWIPQSRCYAEKGNDPICNPSASVQNYLSGRCSKLNVSSTGNPAIDNWGGQYWVRVDCRDTTYYQALNNPVLPLDNVMAQTNGIVDVDYNNTMSPPQAIPAGTVLAVNQQIKIGSSTLVMQADGNLVLYGPNGNGLWATSQMSEFYVPGATAAQNTNCQQCTANFQADGNIVLYNPNSNYNAYKSYWGSNTGGSYGSLFTISAVSPYIKVVNASGLEVWNGKTIQRWLGKDLSHAYGSINGNGWHIAAEGSYKTLSYGPYVSGLPAGNLQAVFELLVDYNSNSETIIDIDVYRNSTNTLFAKATLVRSNFSQANKLQSFVLPFTYDGTGELEFRVSVYGNSYVHHESVRIDKAQ